MGHSSPRTLRFQDRLIVLQYSGLFEKKKKRKLFHMRWTSCAQKPSKFLLQLFTSCLWLFILPNHVPPSRTCLIWSSCKRSLVFWPSMYKDRSGYMRIVDINYWTQNKYLQLVNSNKTQLQMTNGCSKRLRYTLNRIYLRFLSPYEYYDRLPLQSHYRARERSIPT